MLFILSSSTSPFVTIGVRFPPDNHDRLCINPDRDSADGDHGRAQVPNPVLANLIFRIVLIAGLAVAGWLYQGTPA